MKNLDRRYILTFIVSCLFILSIGLNNAYSVFIVPLSDVLEAGRGTITLASTISDLICGSLSPLLVVLLNKVKLSRLLFASTIAYGILTAGIGLFPNVVIFYIINILKGFVFVVFGCNVIIIVLGNWFEKGRQTLIGIAIAFTGLGGAAFSQIFAYLLAHSGLMFTFLVYGIMTIILALPAIFILKYQPEEVGLSMLKDDKKKEDKKLESKNRPFKLSDPVFIGICVIYFILVFLTNVSAHFPGYAQSIGLGHIAASTVSYMMISSIIFKVGMGIICDKFGPKSGFPITIITVLVSFVIILAGHTEFYQLLGSFLFGGIFSTLIILNPFIRYCFGDEQYPEVFSKVMVVSALSNLGGPIVGYIYDFTGSYASSLYASCLLCILAMIIYAITIRIAEKV